MIPTKIRIDLDGQKDISVPIILSAGDTNAYGLILEFFQRGQPFDITGFNLAVFAKRAGSNTPIADVGTVTGGKGYYVIKPSMYIYQGETQLEIVLTDTGSVVTKVLHFAVRSGFSVNGGSVIDEADYSVLTTLIQRAQSSIQQADYFTAYAQAQGDYAKSAADGVKVVFPSKSPLQTQATKARRLQNMCVMVLMMKWNCRRQLLNCQAVAVVLNCRKERLT